jgi:outer membrane protein assembly factor BamB
VKQLLIIVLFLISSGCSLDTKSGIWTKKEDIKEENIIEIFKRDEVRVKEFNPTLDINLNEKIYKNIKQIPNTNDIGFSNFNSTIKKTSKFKFKKIDNFSYFEPDLVSDGKNFVFFDDKLNLFNFGINLKLVWKNNFYTKIEKKNKLLLSMALAEDTLIIADTIGKIFKVDFVTGKLIWEKKSLHPFNSQIKIYKDKIYTMDFNNVVRCFSTFDGKELWNFNSENVFLKSGKRKSLVIKDDVIYFNNSIGDITALNANNGVLIWQLSTQNTLIYENAFSLKLSDLIIADKDLIFSNNKNEFFSVSLNNGFLNWKQNINSSVMPVVVDKFIFSISDEGYLFIIDKLGGNIIKITDLFDVFNNKKRKKIHPVGFVIGKNNLYLTTSHGRLLVVDLKKGKTKSIKKLDNKMISRPFIFSNQIFLATDNSIIKLD